MTPQDRALARLGLLLLLGSYLGLAIGWWVVTVGWF